MVLVSLLASSVQAASVAPRPWSEAPLPRGLPKLARSAGFETLPPAWRTLEELTRRLHAPYGELGARAVPALSPEDAQPGDLLVPVPLDAAAWSKALGRPVPADGLVTVLLEDRRAACLFRGLSTLDDGLLAAFQRDPESLQRIYREAPDTWAVFARSLETDAANVAVPGGREALPLWERAVGESASHPARFAAALMSPDGGRLAWLYDVAARLDPARQRYLLGLDLPDRELRLKHLRRLRALLSAEPDWWRALRPMSRPWPDLETVLRRARLDATGRLLLPPGLPLEALEIDDAEGLGARSVAAPALLEWALAGDAAQRARRELQLAFVQRAWDARAPGPPGELGRAVLAIGRRPMLAITLEAAGVPEARALTVAAAKAEQIDDLPRAVGVPAALAYQGALSLLARSRRSGGLTPEAARGAALRLIALPPEPCALAAWLQQLVGEAPAGAERALIERLAGPPPAGGSEVEWDDLRYRIDPTAAERERLQRWRRLQRGATLDQALQACGQGSAGVARADADAQLADVLRGFVYARSLGWPDGQNLAGAALAARHDLEWGASSWERGPWSLPSEELLPGQPRRVRGSLLGLELALALRQLRRLAPDLPARPPSLQQDYRLPLAWRAAGLQPAGLRTGAAHAASQALHQGRERLRAAGRDAARLDALAVAARLPAWRRRVLPWLAARAPEDLPEAFMPAELARLGGLEGEGWGWSPLRAEALLGPLRPLETTPEDVRAFPPGPALPAAWPDLELRVLELLDELGLGEAAPTLLGSLLQEFIDTAQPVGLDDAESWQRFAAALGPHQLEDHVSALVALGVLQPVFAPARRP